MRENANSEWRIVNVHFSLFAISWLRYSQPSYLLALGCNRGDRDQEETAAFRGLGPGGDVLDRYRQRGRDADREASLARRHFQPVERAIDLGWRRHRIEHHVGVNE